MWHVLHLIARPIEALLGVFCVLSAIVLYPDEEGTLQSKFEDFWVRVDDYQHLALSKHAAFMTQVAKLETRFLDTLFGQKLISLRSIEVSISCSLISSILGLSPIFRLFVGDYAISIVALVFNFFIVGGLFLLVGKTVVAKRRITRVVLAILAIILFSLLFTMPISVSAAQSLVLVGGFLSDIAFIAATRWLVRAAGTMTRFWNVAAVVILTILLAFVLVGPYPAVLYTLIYKKTDPGIVLWYSAFVALTNVFDVMVALIFVLLSLILLIHRALWPLLTRTLFRMADIGTKGRRAILTTVGFALLAAGVTGKVPELLQKLIEKLGG
jgi:hypothetical protein